MPPKPDDFLDVADILATRAAAELGEYEAAWDECEDARARSAVSRAYYAAFRVLKARLIPRRIEWRKDPNRFPWRGIHELLRRSLESHLGDRHIVVVEMKALLRRRNDSDYGFQPYLTCSDAQDDIAAAADAIESIEALSDDELDGIALALVQANAQR